MSTNHPDNEYLLKLCFIGNPTDHIYHLMRFFQMNIFDNEGQFVTLGFDVSTLRMTIDNKPIKLILVLTTGSKFFGKLRPSYYRGACGAVIFFDKSDRKSFNAVPDWFEEFRNFIPMSPIGLTGLTIKPSMHREPEIIISAEEGQSLADKLNLLYFDSPYPPSKLQFEKFLTDLARQALND